MNLQYTAILALLAAGTVNGQWARPIGAKLGTFQAEKDAMPGTGAGIQGVAKAAGDTVLYEDFANGLTGNTAFGAWTTSGPDAAVWQYDTNGPSGDFSNPATEKIQSTTFANGFMIFDSNLSNNGCSGATCVNRVGSLTSPVLDLTATPDVQLKFEQRLRWCCSGDAGHWVDISTDGGLSFPTRIDVGNGALNEPMVTNLDIGTHVKWIDLSQIIAGNASAVVIRFTHEDVTTGNITHYHWQVDDVALVETPSHDMQFTLNQYDDFISSLQVLSGNSESMEYTLYPYGQLHPLALKSKIRNGGNSTETNVSYNVQVLDPASAVIFDQTTTIPSMARYATDSLQFDAFTPPATEGEYTVNFTLSADDPDGEVLDNTFTKTFGVDPFVYAYDDGAMGGRFSETANPIEICNKFFVHNDAMVYAVLGGFATAPQGQPTPVGSEVIANIYDGNGDLFVESVGHFIATSELNATGQSKFTTLLIDPPLTLPAGEYLVTIQGFGDPFYVATSGISEQGSSLIADPSVTDGAAQFFIQNNTPMIRLSFDPSVGIEEGDFQNGVGLGQCLPNPATDAVVIPFELKSGTRMRLELRDVSGKLVRVLEEGTRTAGAHRLELNVRDLNEGVYFYTLTTSDVRLTKRMTVVR